MIKVKKIIYLNSHKLKLFFNDNSEKILDFDIIATYQGIEESLKDTNYFKNVKLFRNGRSFGWDNGYDCCADWAYNYINN